MFPNTWFRIIIISQHDGNYRTDLSIYLQRFILYTCAYTDSSTYSTGI